MDRSETHRRRYESWVHSYGPELYRYAYRLAGNRQLAEDLTQETFVEAWRSVDKQSEAGRARAWLFQILRFRYSHFLRDTRRQREVRPLSDSPDHHPADLTRQPLDKLADQDEIQTALDSLSPMIRQTFLMVFSEGLTCRETAEALEIPLGTVLSRLDSGRRALRAAMTRISGSGSAQGGAASL